MQDMIEREIILNASIERVWATITDHEEFGEWFRAKISKPFVLGETNFCSSLYPGHEHLTWEQKTVEMEPMNRFSILWPAYYGDNVDRDAREDPWLTVTFLLEAQGDKTRVVLRETGFAQLPPDYAPLAFRMNESGWDEQMNNIETYLAK